MMTVPTAIPTPMGLASNTPDVQSMTCDYIPSTS